MLTAQIHVKSLSGQTTGASFALGFAHHIVFRSEVAQFAGGGIKIPLHAVGVELDAAERIDIESLRVAFQIDPRNAIVNNEVHPYDLLREEAGNTLQGRD